MIPSCLSLGICELIVSEPIVVLQRQESEHIKEKIIMASSVSPKEEHVAESASVSASAAASAAASSASVTESDSVATSASPPQNPPLSIPLKLSQLWLKINDISQAISPERSDSPDGSAAIYPPIGAVPVSRPGPEPVPVPVPVSDAKVFILGNEYVSSDTKSILGDIESKIWLTYRSGFEAIPKAFDGPSPLSFIHSMIFNRNLALTLNIHGLTDNENFTTDVGWGCMIRTSQSLLANALQILLLGRDYSYNDARGIEAGAPDSDSKNTLGESKNINTSESTSDTSGSGNFEVIAGTSLKGSFADIHCLIINLFQDSSAAPFSIHNFIKVAGELPLQVKPGQWFGPNAASLSIQRLCKKTAYLKAIISESSDLYDEPIVKLLQEGPLLILLPIRLGIDNISPYYYDSLGGLLALSQSVGIAGGKPSSSYYFFGYEGEGRKFLYLDPHYPQIATDPTEKTTDEGRDSVDSYHTTKYLTLDINQMDPSMLVGFLVKTPEDYNNFQQTLTQTKNKIIHFHKSENPLTSTSSNRKMSELINTSDPSSQDEDEEFIQIGDSEGDFIDLGVDEEIDQLSEILVAENLEEPIKIEKEEIELDSETRINGDGYVDVNGDGDGEDGIEV